MSAVRPGNVAPMRFACLLLCLLVAPVCAQQPAGSGRSIQAKVSADYAEVRAGPGAAYVSRGRVYGGDILRVTKRSDSGEWYEIVGPGVAGWVRARAIDLQRGAVVPTNPGRDRKTSNYGYDDRGRRIGTDGARQGSGEGTAGSRRARRPKRNRPGAGALHVRVSLGAMQMKRGFESNIAIDSALADLSVSATGFGYEFEVDYLVMRYVSVRALFRDTRFATVEIPANAAFGFENAVEVSTSAQHAQLDVTGRYPIAEGWVGAYLGGSLLRHQFQETQPYALFLTNSFISGTGGGAAGWRFGPVEVAARGGIMLPLSISQSPTEGGDPNGSGIRVGAELTWHLARRFAVVGHWHFTRMKSEYDGVSTHIDTHTGAEEGYSAARETDQFQGGGLGLRWTPL